jgi:4-aminobutyrate aminotransferase
MAILLIFDEVQSGFGRTGKWFAQEHFDVVPDIMTVAKGIASGLPLSGVFSRLDLMKRWETGSHGGTYGGNPVACAAGVATIRAMREDEMLENARIRGEQLSVACASSRRIIPDCDVRGLGLMIDRIADDRGNLTRLPPRRWCTQPRSAGCCS